MNNQSNSSNMNEYEGMKVGDLVTGYHKGYHRLLVIEHRKSFKPLFHYRCEFNASGKKMNSKQMRCCDAGFCRPAADSVEEAINTTQKKLDNLTALKKQLTS